MALGVGLYIIPLAMIANPDLIRVLTQPANALLSFALVGAGLSCLSYALIGRAALVRRALLGIAGFALCFAGVLING